MHANDDDDDDDDDNDNNALAVLLPVFPFSFYVPYPAARRRAAAR